MAPSTYIAATAALGILLCGQPQSANAQHVDLHLVSIQAFAEEVASDPTASRTVTTGFPIGTSTEYYNVHNGPFGVVHFGDVWGNPYVLGVSNFPGVGAGAFVPSTGSGFGASAGGLVALDAGAFVYNTPIALAYADPTQAFVQSTHPGIGDSTSGVVIGDPSWGTGGGTLNEIWGNEVNIIANDKTQFAHVNAPAWATETNTISDNGVSSNSTVWGVPVVSLAATDQVQYDLELLDLGDGYANANTQDHDVRVLGLRTHNQSGTDNLEHTTVATPVATHNGLLDTTTGTFTIQQGDAWGTRYYVVAHETQFAAASLYNPHIGTEGGGSVQTWDEGQFVWAGAGVANQQLFNLQTLPEHGIIYMSSLDSTIYTESDYEGALLDVDLLPNTAIPFSWALPGTLDYIAGGPLLPAVDAIDNAAASIPVSGGAAGSSVAYRFIGDRSATE